VAIDRRWVGPFHIFMGRVHMILPALRLGCVGAVAAWRARHPGAAGGALPSVPAAAIWSWPTSARACQPLRSPSRWDLRRVIKEAMQDCGLPGGVCAGGRPLQSRAEKLKSIVAECWRRRANALLDSQDRRGQAFDTDTSEYRSC